MLSGETAKGTYPVQSGEEQFMLFMRSALSHFQLVLMMAETCVLAERAIAYPPLFDEVKNLQARPTETTETVAMAAVAAAFEQNAGALLVLSTSGNTARLLSKYRPDVPIICG